MLGYQAKLYRGAAPLAGLPSTGDWSEIKIVKDVTSTSEYEEVDVTTRAGNGRKLTDLGLQDNGCEFEMAWDPADVGFAALLAAHQGRSPVALAVMDGDIDVPGSSGVAGNWKISKFTRSEPLSGQVVAQVKAVPFSYMADYEVVGS